MQFNNKHLNTQNSLSTAVKNYYNNAKIDRNLLQSNNGYVHHHFGIGMTEFDYTKANTEAITEEIQRLETNTTDHLITLLQFDSMFDKKENVIDLGCGRGGTIFKIADTTSKNVTVHGITISDYQTEFCNEQIKKKNLQSRVFVKEANYHNIPYENEFFTHALCCETTQYTKNLNDLFKEVNRVMKPGGRFVIVTWCYDDSKDTSNFHEFIEPINENYGSTMHGTNEYLESLSNNGFKVLFKEDFHNDAINYWNVRSSWEHKSGVEPFFLEPYKRDEFKFFFIVSVKQ